MPELEGARSLDDIMESHRAAGRFDAERWQLGYIPGKPEAASVLLMAEVPGRDVWEVVYLGLTPAARAVVWAVRAPSTHLSWHEAHVSRLELAVDCRNIPAARLYQSTGFVTRDRRAVHLAILGQSRDELVGRVSCRGHDTSCGSVPIVANSGRSAGRGKRNEARVACGIGRPVPEDFSLLEVDHRLGDLGGVVGDPLEVARGVDQPQPGIDPFGIADDLGLELLLDGAVVAVDP